MQPLKIIPQLFLFASIIVTGIAEAACNGSESRYTLQGGGEEVLDSSTGLIWKRCSEGLSSTDCTTGSVSTVDWKVSVEPTSGSWRLPNVKELASLLEPGCASPMINTTLFPATLSDAYWAATPDTGSAANAWRVDFSTGVISSAVKTNTAIVRLVRDE